MQYRDFLELGIILVFNIKVIIQNSAIKKKCTVISQANAVIEAQAKVIQDLEKENESIALENQKSKIQLAEYDLPLNTVYLWPKIIVDLRKEILKYQHLLSNLEIRTQSTLLKEISFLENMIFRINQELIEMTKKYDYLKLSSISSIDDEE